MVSITIVQDGVIGRIMRLFGEMLIILVGIGCPLVGHEVTMALSSVIAVG